MEFENQTIKKLQTVDPDWFLNFTIESSSLIDTIGQIANIYNKNLSRFKEAFEVQTIKAIKKGIPENKANAWRNIGICIGRDNEPLMTDIIKVGEILA